MYDRRVDRRFSTPWGKFCDETHRVSREVATRKDGEAIIPAVFRDGGGRNKADVLFVTALGLDIDGKQEFMAVEEVHERLPFAGVAYSTFSSTPENPRYRVILPFEKQLVRADFTVIWHWVNSVTGGKLMDPACKDPGRIYYTPGSPKHALEAGWPWAKTLDGPFLSMDAVPASFANSVEIPRWVAQPVSTGQPRGLHVSPTTEAEAAACLEKALAHPVIIWAKDNPTLVSREVWRGIAGNLVCAADGHTTVMERALAAFHEISEVDEARYRPGATNEEWEEAKKSAASVGPMTFAHMVTHGLPADFVTDGAKCMVIAARAASRSRRSVTLMAMSGSTTTTATAIAPVVMAASQVSTAPSGTSTTLLPSGISYPDIDVRDQFRWVDKEARRALVAANIPPKTFRSAGTASRILVDENGARLLQHTEATLTLRLSEVANWIKVTESNNPKRLPKEDPVFPEARVVHSILDDPPLDLPMVERVATAPFFGHDGRLIDSSGYHASERTYLELDPGLVVPPVPPVPTMADLDRARSLLLDDCLGDFPFKTEGDRAHAVAMLIGPFVVSLVDATSPLHLLVAPEAGTGKSLLGDVGALIATGSRMRYRAFPTQEEERGKAIFTALLSAWIYVAFDNVKGDVESPSLESALTSEFVMSRLLGGNTEAYARNRALWVMSANNAQLCRDLIRRAIRILLDARMEKPEQRTSFRHQDLPGWIKANRADLIWAVLVLVQNWLALGQPKSKSPVLASFERWSAVLGGILEAADIPGFLDPATTLDGVDPKRSEAEAFVAEWFTTFDSKDVTAKALLDEICAPPEPTGYQGAMQPPRSVTHLASVMGMVQVGGRAARLGRWLSENRDRFFGGHRIELGKRDGHGKVPTYRVAPSGGNKVSGEGDAGGGAKPVDESQSAAPKARHDVAPPQAAPEKDYGLDQNNITFD